MRGFFCAFTPLRETCLESVFIRVHPWLKMNHSARCSFSTIDLSSSVVTADAIRFRVLRKASTPATRRSGATTQRRGVRRFVLAADQHGWARIHGRSHAKARRRKVNAVKFGVPVAAGPRAGGRVMLRAFAQLGKVSV